MPVPGIAFRPICPEDMPALLQIFVSTRIDELASLDWSPEQVQDFLQKQFDAQHMHYQKHFSVADYDIILYHDEIIGRLYIDRTDVEIHILDIALLPDFRNRGIGRVLLQDLLDEAVATNKFVRIFVEQYNPALRLYQRLGFQEIDHNGVYYEMTWTPEQVTNPATPPDA